MPASRNTRLTRRQRAGRAARRRSALLPKSLTEKLVDRHLAQHRQPTWLERIAARWMHRNPKETAA